MIAHSGCRENLFCPSQCLRGRMDSGQEWSPRRPRLEPAPGPFGPHLVHSGENLFCHGQGLRGRMNSLHKWSPRHSRLEPSRPMWSTHFGISWENLFCHGQGLRGRMNSSKVEPTALKKRLTRSLQYSEGLHAFYRFPVGSVSSQGCVARMAPLADIYVTISSHLNIDHWRHNKREGIVTKISARVRHTTREVIVTGVAASS